MFRNIPDLPLSAAASFSTRSRVSQVGGTEIRFEGSVYRYEVMSWLGFEPMALALKARKDRNINGLILRRFPRFFIASKDLK
jgi:hypothetical protein